MRLLDGFTRADVARLTGVLFATATVAACCVGVSSAAAGIIRTIPTGSHPDGVSSDGTHVWITNSAEDTVTEIEASSGTVIRTIHVGSSPEGVSSDGTHVWVANQGGTVSEIEASSGTVIHTIHVGNVPEGVSSDGAHAWVTNYGEGTVSEIEASSGTVIRTIAVGVDPVGVSSDGTHVWVANSGDGIGDTVSEIEASSGTLIHTIHVGNDPEGVSSDGANVWVVDSADDAVSEIEASSGTLIHTIRVGGEPTGVSSDGTHVWVTNYGEGTVSQIEASSGIVTRTIQVGSGPYDVSSDGTDAWVTNFFEDTVSEISPSAPEARIESPASGGTYLQGAVVTTKFSCTEGEGEPGLESCTDSNGGSGTSGTLETATTGPHTYTVTAKSKDGQTDTASISYTVVEAFPPRASIESPASNGTYFQDAVVTTKFSCAEGEGGPGLESCTDSNGGSGTSGALETATTGPHTYTVTAKSKDGQTDTASISYTVVAPGKCTGNTGSVTLSPGLTDTAVVQTVKIKGSLTGCAGKAFTGATYTATLTTAGPVSCSVLKTVGELATGAAKYTWTPKAKASTGTLGMPLTDLPGAAFAGEVKAGSYSPLTLSGTLSESYTGGATCGEKVGRKAAKGVKKGTFSGSAVSF